MPALLFEIGCEELPASACREAETQLPELCRRHLGAEPSALYVGPRRLALIVEDFPGAPADEERRGPPEQVAFDEEGGPTEAAEGFARAQGIAVQELVRREGHVWARVQGVPLGLRLLFIIGDLSFGKSMRWAPEPVRFARPVRWLCSMLDSEVISIGTAGVRSSNVTFGHRFTSAEIEIPDAGAYAGSLRNAGVEPDAAERRRQIVEALDGIGGWSDPASVLEEVVYLVESPLVLEGRFDERFLELPQSVVEAAMQSHQRYFPLGGARFAFVANGGDPELVRAGNEAVLEGRLEDASFTFERDVRQGIDALAGRLGSITFFAGAGSFADKAERLRRLVERLGGGEASLEAARLAKADQAAELVREFPDLEGRIGAEYARLAGYPEAVCKAIEEQYRPDAAGGPLPETEAGKVLAAADKIDNLTVAFSLGHKPTGSRDPYGLRRAAIGLCRLAVEGGLAIDLSELPAEVAEFLEERLESLLAVPVEYVRAARRSAVRELGGMAALAEALASLGDEQLGPVHTVYTRADRIAGKTDGAGSVDPGLLGEQAELEVARALERVEPRIASALGERRFEEALAAAAELGPPLERFFDEVLVMTEDSAIRANRLRLLLDVRDAVGQLGDFSQIPR